MLLVFFENEVFPNNDFIFLVVIKLSSSSDTKENMETRQVLLRSIHAPDYNYQALNIHNLIYSNTLNYRLPLF